MFAFAIYERGTAASSWHGIGSAKSPCIRRKARVLRFCKRVDRSHSTSARRQRHLTHERSRSCSPTDICLRPVPLPRREQASRRMHNLYDLEPGGLTMDRYWRFVGPDRAPGSRGRGSSCRGATRPDPGGRPPPTGQRRPARHISLGRGGFRLGPRCGGATHAAGGNLDVHHRLCRADVRRGGVCPRRRKPVGTRHHEERLELAKARELATSMLGRLDEPLGDASILPTYLLARFTRRHVTVALSGDGGDELFAGYDPFAALSSAILYDRIVPQSVHRTLRRLVDTLPISSRNMSLDFKLRRALLGLSYSRELWNPVWLAPADPAAIAELFCDPLPSEELYSEAIEIWESGAERDSTWSIVRSSSTRISICKKTSS